VKSAFILQPGPAALTEGVTRVHRCLRQALGLPPEALQTIASPNAS